jgi:fatty acid desaturase
VLTEDRGSLAPLLLNNNLHAVHHARPQVPWYRLPAEYARLRDEFLRRNGGYCYRSYGEVCARYFLRRKEPVADPIWTQPERPPEGETARRPQ